MANIKSQIKRNRQNNKRRLRNRVNRGAARTAIRDAHVAIDAGVPESKAALMQAISLLDRAASKGVIHKNNAAATQGPPDEGIWENGSDRGGSRDSHDRARNRGTQEGNTSQARG